MNSIYVKGIRDQYSEIYGLKLASLTNALTKNLKTESQRTVLLLCHNPDAKELLKDYRWDLMLCGHTHGGQLKIPITNWTHFPRSGPFDGRGIIQLERKTNSYYPGNRKFMGFSSELPSGNQHARTFLILNCVRQGLLFKRSGSCMVPGPCPFK